MAGNIWPTEYDCRLRHSGNILNKAQSVSLVLFFSTPLGLDWHLELKDSLFMKFPGLDSEALKSVE